MTEGNELHSAHCGQLITSWTCHCMRAHLILLKDLLQAFPLDLPRLYGESAFLDDSVNERAVVVPLPEGYVPKPPDRGGLEVRENGEVHGAHPWRLDERDLGSAVVVVHGALHEVVPDYEYSKLTPYQTLQGVFRTEIGERLRVDARGDR